MIITSVIVTYNRKDCLDKLLKIYDNLEYMPNNIIIVDNNSIDGTDLLINDWLGIQREYSKFIISMDKNIGGSGGFYEGIKKAIEIGSDWIYVSDDDAFPSNDIFKIFSDFINNNKKEYIDKISAICSKVINNGKIDIEHRRRIKQGVFSIREYNIKEEEYNTNFELDLFSYVGTMINSKYINYVGLTEKDYFIYYDDTEHSLRLSRKGKIICIPSAEVIHDIKSDINKKLSWKYYYGYRNRLLMIKKHYKKRYFVFECVLDRMKAFKRILCFNFKDAYLINKSVNDAIKGVYGISKEYKP